MSDDAFGSDEGGGIDRVEEQTSTTRYSTVTDSLDTVFGLLRDSRRRYFLYYLFTVDGDVVEFEAAVTAVYKYEAAGAEANDQSSREEIRIALHHDHLPRLANAEILDYDRRHGTIRFTGHPPLEEWVEHARWKELD